MEHLDSSEATFVSNSSPGAVYETDVPGDTPPTDGAKIAARRLNGDNSPVVPTSCAICLDSSNGKPHRCGRCAPGAWACCEGCELSLLDHLCPVCRGDYARAPREWSKLAALQAATGESVTSLALLSVPSQLGLIELAHSFPRLEHLSIVIPRFDQGNYKSDAPVAAIATSDAATSSMGARDSDNMGEAGASIERNYNVSDNIEDNVEDGADSSASITAGQPLDFAAVGTVFPRLTSLELDGFPRLERLVFTQSNTPRLVRLAVRRCGRKCSQLLLTLPRLTELELVDLSWDSTAASVMLGGALNGCPRLLSCTLTRVHGLGGDHFVGLPRLTKFVATHCDGLEQLDLVDCSQLAEVVLEGSKELKRLRLHDVGVRTAKYSPFHLATAPPASAAIVSGSTAETLTTVPSESHSGRASLDGARSSNNRGAAAEEVTHDGHVTGSRVRVGGRPLSLWNVEDSIGFGVEDAGALTVALDEVRNMLFLSCQRRE